MEQNDLEKIFAGLDTPAPDPERKKESLNLAVAAFEAQKSAISEKNVKFRQGMSWLARLISQINKSERKDDMNTSNKRYIYGGLATACIALMVGANYMVSQSTRSGGSSTERLVEYNVSQAPASSAVSESFRKSVEEKNIVMAEQALRGGGSALPVPVAPAQDMAMAESVAPAAPMAMATKRMAPAGAMVGSQGMDTAVASKAYAPIMEVEGRDNFTRVDQNTIKQVKAEPVSTFSIDVDTSSYSFVRQSLDNGVLPQKDAVRVEEMVNYFDYAYPLPSSKDEPFKTSVAVKDSPWNEGKRLVTIGIKGYDVEKTAQPDSNLVFLVDTSGSMNEPKKLPLLKQSLSMLLDSLKPTDKVSIVAYAGAAGTVLQPTEAAKKNEILQALQNLSASGSTAGGEGIRLAYQLAQSNFNKDAVNRVILATDGDFNVGITDENELKGFIERQRESGIFLSVIGFGTGNYNDALMQTLAQNGNGTAAYIDTLNEARKVLVQEASKALFPIAKDVKIQVEFNPSAVSEYRLVGYETRALKTEDFNNDKVDAGDIGAGAEVTAIYEVTPVGTTPSVDPSRYSAEEKATLAQGNELAFVKVRYKLPNENTSKLIETPVVKNQETEAALKSETAWAEAVAGFAQLLKGGQYTGTLTYDDVLKQAEANKGADPFGYRAEFITLVHKAKTAATMPQQGGASGGVEGLMPYQPMPMTR